MDAADIFRSTSDVVHAQYSNLLETGIQELLGILENNEEVLTKYFVLQVLEGLIKYKWNEILDERSTIKELITHHLFLSLSSDEHSQQEWFYLNKLYLVFIQIVKHDPTDYDSFITRFFSLQPTSVKMCKNMLTLMKLLSEEFFVFSKGEMTRDTTINLKLALRRDYDRMSPFLLEMLSCPGLKRATVLSTLMSFSSWIQMRYIFETNLFEKLCNCDFSNLQAPCKNSTLQFLTEVASFYFGNTYNSKYLEMYRMIMNQLPAILEVKPDSIVDSYTAGSREKQETMESMAMFLISFYKVHIAILEKDFPMLVKGLSYLIDISYVDDTDFFKICLDFWNSFVNLLANESSEVDGLNSQSRKQQYADLMSKLRMLMIRRMANPEDVLEYQTMRETLINLVQLDCDGGTRKQMSELLTECQKLNDWKTLCWAIGSISGYLTVDFDQDKSFIEEVRVKCEYLYNQENIKTEGNGEFVRAHYMRYVVVGYQRYLTGDPEFFKHYVEALFKHMTLGEYPVEIKDMAWGTFLEIAKRDKNQLIRLEGKKEPFVFERLFDLNIENWAQHQKLYYYKSVGHVIQADEDKKDNYNNRLMEVPYKELNDTMQWGNQQFKFCKDQERIRTFLNNFQILRASPFGKRMLPLFRCFSDTFRMCSELISKSISEGGPDASKTSYVKLLRSVKREILNWLNEIFLQDEDETTVVDFAQNFMYTILSDYPSNVPHARDSEVLSLFATIITKYKGTMSIYVRQIFQAVFPCTYEMITENLGDFPKHRLELSALIHAIATHCFSELSNQQYGLVMDYIRWGYKHTERNIAEAGLNL